MVRQPFARHIRQVAQASGAVADLHDQVFDVVLGFECLVRSPPNAIVSPRLARTCATGV